MEPKEVLFYIVKYSLTETLQQELRSLQISIIFFQIRDYNKSTTNKRNWNIRHPQSVFALCFTTGALL